MLLRPSAKIYLTKKKSWVIKYYIKVRVFLLSLIPIENTVRELESVHQSYPGKVKYLQESLDRNEEGRDILLEKVW
jgi:hypothetical protein